MAMPAPGLPFDSVARSPSDVASEPRVRLREKPISPIQAPSQVHQQAP
jgi:hypothetical protein